jgi:cytoskeletal protein RodZ
MARVFLFAVAVMLVAAGVLVYVLLRNRPGAESPAEGAGARMVTPAEPPASGTPAGQPTTLEPAAAAPVSSSPGSTRGPMRLELHPNGPCWVSVEADGKVVLSRMMQSGERETLTVPEGVAITVGDAAAFAFTIDGREGRPLGRAGEVKTARITRATLAEFVR